MPTHHARASAMNATTSEKKTKFHNHIRSINIHDGRSVPSK